MGKGGTDFTNRIPGDPLYHNTVTIAGIHTGGGGGGGVNFPPFKNYFPLSLISIAAKVVDREKRLEKIRKLA